MATDACALPAELQRLIPATLHARCEPLRVARGTVLFETGRRPSAMHFVHAGEVVLQRIGVDGQLVVLQRTRHGVVGEASLQSDRYHCDAVALADTTLVRVPRQPLLDALKTDAAFALRWIGMLNQEMRRLRQQCERLCLNTVEARLLHLLRTEGDASGLRLQAGLKSLAREIGVTHEALYRCVAALERRGQLRRADGRLVLGATARPAMSAGSSQGSADRDGRGGTRLRAARRRAA